MYDQDEAPPAISWPSPAEDWLTPVIVQRRDRLLGILRLYTQDDGTAEDLFHEFLIKIVKKFGRLEVPNKPEAWLAAALRYFALDRCRAKSREIALRPLPEGFDPAAADDTGSTLEEEQEAARRRWRDFLEAVDLLPPQYRGIIVGLLVEGREKPEVARMERISLSRLYKLLPRVIAQTKEIVSR